MTPGVEVVTEKTEKCQKWKENFVFLSWTRYTQGIPINCSLNCSSQSIDCCKISPLPKQCKDKKFQKLQVSGKSSLILEGAMILCLQCADLSMTFRLWKFQKLWLYSEHVIASCAHSQATKGLNIFSSQKVDHWSIKCKGLGSNSKYLDTGFNKMQGMTYMCI